MLSCALCVVVLMVMILFEYESCCVSVVVDVCGVCCCVYLSDMMLLEF